jgi:thioredoxin reductase
VLGYGAEIVSATVVRLGPTSIGFDVVLDIGARLAARRVLIATGLTDELPDIPGVYERWGTRRAALPVLPRLRGRDQALGILGSGPKSVHQALLVLQLSPDMVFSTTRLAR